VLPAPTTTDPLLVNVPAMVRLLLFMVNVAPGCKVKLLANELADKAGKTIAPDGISTLVVLKGTPPHQFVEVFQLDVVPNQVPVERTLMDVDSVKGPPQPLAITDMVAVPVKAGFQVAVPVEPVPLMLLPAPFTLQV